MRFPPRWRSRFRFAWPAARQLLERDPAGLGRAAMSHRSRTLLPRTCAADKVVPSVCPYCGVGCAQLVYVRDGRLTDIEGDAASPVSEGSLCARGAATFQLVTGDHRLQRVLYRRPYGRRWETLRLEKAMEMVADRVQRTRDASWEETSASGVPHRRTLAISCLAGGTLGNEESYLIRKLFTGGLGIPQAGVRTALLPGAGDRFDADATTFLQDLMQSDCILIGGSNMAECHPVGFRWVMAAKRRGATVIHVDPRFTRTSAVADLHVPLRAGTDIAFLGGIIRFIVENRRHFHDYVVHYTNAAAFVADDFRDTEDLDGLFSGWDPATGRYDPASWGAAGSPGATGGDPTLQHPRCVFQVIRRHYSRYTPTLVEAVCGVPQDLFLRVAEELCASSGRERTAAFCVGAGWTQHTVGAQVVRAATIIQLLLGNLGRPGGGLLVLAGHASSRGAADVGGAASRLPGYLPMPTTDTQTLASYLEKDRRWGEGKLGKRIVSLLKAWYGKAAVAGNDWCFGCLPLQTGDHSPAAVAMAMADGAVKGHFVIGANPAVGSLNGPLQRQGLRQLEWLVVRDLAPTETAEFWCHAPEIDAGEVGPEEIATEVFFFPAAAHTEKDGSFTSTQRLVQWHHAAVPPPGEARSDLHFIYHLGRRLQALYAGSTSPRDRAIRSLAWDYPVQGEHGEPVAAAVLFEIGGFTVAGREPLPGLAALREDGSTACGCWLYAGCCADGVNRPANRRPAVEQGRVAPDWGWAWPGNRRLLGNCASADPEGRPWSERKRYVWRDAATGGWTGYDIPDLPGGPGEGEGTPVALLFDPGSIDGPLPTHYEPQESVVKNLLYRQQCNPVRVEWQRNDNPYHRGWDDPRFPCILTTCRLSEHHAAGGMSRWLTWLCELQPAMFCEVSPQLAAEEGLENGDWATIVTARAEIEARVLVTPRLQPLAVGGRIVHQIALPSHWGRCGRSRGDSANDLIALAAGPGSGSEASKAFTGAIRPGRRRRGRWAAFGHSSAGAPPAGAPRDVPAVDRSRPAGPHGRRGGGEEES